MKEEKRIKKEKEIELAQKAISGKPMTMSELEAYQKYKTKEVVDQVFKAIGAIMAVLLFIVAFDFFYEGSLLGLLFSPTEYAGFWEAMYVTGNYFDDPLIIGQWLGVFIITVVQIALCGGIAATLVFYVKDVLGVITDFFKGTGKVTKELAVTLKEAVTSEVSQEKKRGRKKKSLFDDTEESSLSTEELDALLTQNKPEEKEIIEEKRKESD